MNGTTLNFIPIHATFQEPSEAGLTFEFPLGVLTHEMVAPLPISLTDTLKNNHDPER